MSTHENSKYPALHLQCRPDSGSTSLPKGIVIACYRGFIRGINPTETRVCRRCFDARNQRWSSLRRNLSHQRKRSSLDVARAVQLGYWCKREKRGSQGLRGVQIDSEGGMRGGDWGTRDVAPP
jgi:hypothetical protein